MSQGNLQHFRGIRSYAFLIWLIVGMSALVIFTISSLASVAGLADLLITGEVALAIIWLVAGYVAVGRFMAIEQRKPTFSEASSVGVWSLLTFLMIVAAILVVVLCFMIFGLASGAEMGGGQGAGAKGKDAADAAGGLNKIFKPLMGFFGALTWIYLVPLLSFVIFPLFQRPPTLEAEV